MSDLSADIQDVSLKVLLGGAPVLFGWTAAGRTTAERGRQGGVRRIHLFINTEGAISWQTTQQTH